MKANVTNTKPEEQENEEFDEELENDLYLFELQKRLNKMKKDRKKADQDAELLKNRLNLLKGEENKVIIFDFRKDMEKS